MNIRERILRKAIETVEQRLEFPYTYQLAREFGCSELIINKALSTLASVITFKPLARCRRFVWEVRLCGDDRAAGK